MNLVEYRFFLPTRRQIGRGAGTRVPPLSAAMRRFLERHHGRALRCAWTKSVDQILA